MVTGWQQICNKDQGFSTALQDNGLDGGVVAWDAHDVDTRKNFAIAVKQVPLAGVQHRLKIFRKITGAVPIGWRESMFELAALHEITSARKSGHWFVVNDAGVTPAVVKMKMRVDDEVDVLWPGTGLIQ